MKPHRFMAYLCIPIKLNEARICIYYFGALLLSIIPWRLRWNLRCRINFFNSLTINLEMLSLCWNNESSYTDVSGGSHNLYSALSNRKQLFERSMLRRRSIGYWIRRARSSSKRAKATIVEAESWYKMVYGGLRHLLCTPPEKLLGKFVCAGRDRR